MADLPDQNVVSQQCRCGCHNGTAKHIGPCACMRTPNSLGHNDCKICDPYIPSTLDSAPSCPKCGATLVEQRMPTRFRWTRFRWTEGWVPEDHQSFWVHRFGTKCTSDA